MIATFNAEAEGITVDEIIRRILEAMPRGEVKKIF